LVCVLSSAAVSREKTKGKAKSTEFWGFAFHECPKNGHSDVSPTCWSFTENFSTTHTSVLIFNIT
jgi:hypothetical protein